MFSVQHASRKILLLNAPEDIGLPHPSQKSRRHIASSVDSLEVKVSVLLPSSAYFAAGEIEHAHATINRASLIKYTTGLSPKLVTLSVLACVLSVAYEVESLHELAPESMDSRVYNHQPRVLRLYSLGTAYLC